MTNSCKNLLIIFICTLLSTNICNNIGASHPHVFGIEIEGLLLKPAANNLDYAAEAIPIPLPSPNWQIFGVHPKYHPGFDLSVYCRFLNSDTNLKLKWERFRSTDYAAFQVPTTDYMVGPFFEIGPDATPYKKTRSSNEFQFDEVNLLAGRYVNIGDCLALNLYAGVNFARIKQELFSNFSNIDNTVVRTINVPTIFKGAGPRFGVEFGYNVLNNFYFLGKTSATLTIGKIKTCSLYKAFAPELSMVGVTPPNKQSVLVSKKLEIVPAFEQKLGVAYMVNCCDYETKIELGYFVQVYINIIQTIEIGSEVNTPPVIPDTIGVYARTFKKDLSNFALAGPYANVSFEF